jgi:hypothetical protein
MNPQDLKDKVKALDKHAVLALVGLETKPSELGRLLRALGTLAVGLVLGTGVALLLAPRAGRELRQYLRDRMRAGGAERETARGASADITSPGS